MSMQAIEHVVVLMLENRSFDSMLGWLYERDSPALNIPAASSSDTYRGLQQVKLADFTNSDSTTGLSSPPIRGVAGFTAPSIGPGEEFEHVNAQLAGPMTGFLADFVATMEAKDVAADEIRLRALEVLQSYTSGQLPVLNQLARHYAVCDAWFASVPSQTNANRAFSLC